MKESREKRQLFPALFFLDVYKRQVESNEVPGGNVSGTSDLTPVKEQIDLMQQIIPDVKKVGLLYCSAEANSVLQIDMAKEALDTAGIEYEDYTVSNSRCV